MKVLIVDDEVQSHTILNYLFQLNHPEVEVVGNAHTIASGLQLLEEHQPELIFLDIELPDGTGFDFLRATTNRQFKVVFITAHKSNDYAITAFRFGSLDFLLKPIDPDELKEAILRFSAQTIPVNGLDRQLEVALESKDRLNNSQLPSRILIANSDELQVCKLEDIAYLKADRNYTDFHFADERPQVIASKNLGIFEQQLRQHTYFMRVHKSYLVNLHFVDGYIRGDSQISLTTGKRIPVSKDKRDQVVQQLKGL
ncbi:MAG: LytTR family DNA-binding domain-containing protein [Bacteroidota bacterium]